jgi:hypothetical protein
MSCDHPPLRDVTADTKNTAFSIVACWTVFTDLLPGSNALIKSVTIYLTSSACQLQKIREAADGGMWLLAAGILLRLFDPEDGGDMFLRNVV